MSIRTGCCELFGLLLNILCCNCQSKNEVKYDETNNETFTGILVYREQCNIVDLYRFENNVEHRRSNTDN